GENAYGLYSAEKGAHRLVRLSPFDAARRRQTSFAGVEVSPAVDDTADIQISDDGLQADTYRASGAGGQHATQTHPAAPLTPRSPSRIGRWPRTSVRATSPPGRRSRATPAPRRSSVRSSRAWSTGSRSRSSSSPGWTPASRSSAERPRDAGATAGRCWPRAVA